MRLVCGGVEQRQGRECILRDDLEQARTRLVAVVKPTAWVRARLSRGWSLSSLGPNEARLLFDAGAGAGGLAAALLFLELFVPSSTSLRQSLPLVAAPAGRLVLRPP